MDAENQPNPTTGDEDTIGTTTENRASVEKTKGKRGRPKDKAVEELVNEKLVNKANFLLILKKELAGKIGKEATKIIIACHKAGWLSECPKAASIERGFGINKSGLKDYIRCHYQYENLIKHLTKPKYKPFTDAELKPIIDRIRKEMEINTDTEK